jgi:16S rRNA (guanine966-N2)-methyltransferase
MTLKITAGSHRGTVLRGLDTIRSTKCIVREAIFNIIASRHPEKLSGCVVMDLFGGTGILSYEALSRGAKRALINDINPIHREVAMHNAAKLAMTDRVSYSEQDATCYRSNFSDVDIVFIDPPYYKDMGGATVDNIVRNKVKDKEILIVIELCKPDVESLCRSGTYPEPRRYGTSYLQVFTV